MGAGCWVLGAGCAGRWLLVAGCWVLCAGCRARARGGALADFGDLREMSRGWGRGRGTGRAGRRGEGRGASRIQTNSSSTTVPPRQRFEPADLEIFCPPPPHTRSPQTPLRARPDHAIAAWNRSRAGTALVFASVAWRGARGTTARVVRVRHETCRSVRTCCCTPTTTSRRCPRRELPGTTCTSGCAPPTTTSMPCCGNPMRARNERCKRNVKFLKALVPPHNTWLSAPSDRHLGRPRHPIP